MEINVSQLLKEPIGSTRNFTIDDTLELLDDSAPSEIEGEVGLTRTNRGILVEGKLQTDVIIDCSRCLAAFTHHLDMSIEEEYFPMTDIVTGLPVAIPDEPGCFSIDEHHIINLAEAVRQYAVMAIPIKALCREDCAGLCPTCGRNLNKGNCGCPPKPMDTRLADLRKMASGQ